MACSDWRCHNRFDIKVRVLHRFAQVADWRAIGKHHMNIDRQPLGMQPFRIGYTVRAVQGGAYSKECQSTTCTLDGLTNNVEYVFQVTARTRRRTVIARRPDRSC